MSTDPRTFHAVQFFAGVSDEVVRMLVDDGGYAGLATKYAELHGEASNLRAHLRAVRAELAALKEVV